MSWRNGLKLFDTVSFRLTLWYCLLFTIVSIGIFSVIAYSVGTGLKQRIDEYLLDQAIEIEVLSSTYSSDELKKEMVVWTEIEGTRDTYIRIFGLNPDTILSSDLSQWKGLPPGPVTPAKLKNEEWVISTTKLPGRRYKTRVVDGVTADGTVIEVGYTLDPYEQAMKDYAEIFGIAIAAMLICGGVVGWTMARGAMAGVQEVTRSARNISSGDLTHRVSFPRKGQEIDDLVAAFNEMLDKIQLLISELSEVTDNIAHDLRSPITRIRGTAEMTITGAKDIPECREMAAEIIEECDQLVGMINTMLEIVETDSGITEIGLKQVNVTEMVEDIFELYHPVAEREGINLSISVPPAPVFVQGDLRRLRRMLANLIDNAVKYTPRGGSVALSVRDNGPGVEISISDTGIGIAPKDISRIFEKFYRADESRSRPGFGLGLSLVRSIVDLHRGTISVTSEPDKGTTFTIVLPRSSNTIVEPAKITKK
jgi:signal transduction histidine kinase